MFPKNKKKITLLSLGLLTIISLLFITLKPQSVPDNEKTSKEIIFCQTLKAPFAEYCSEKALLQYLEKNGPKKSGNLLKTLEENGSLKYNCHNLTHALGYSTSEKSPKLIDQGDTELCGGGYLHGVFQYAAKNGSVARVSSLGVKLCALPGNELQSCIHGIGHALSLAEIGLWDSNQVCDTIASELNVDTMQARAKQDIQFQCISGWAMQYKLNLSDNSSAKNQSPPLPSPKDFCLPLQSTPAPYSYCILSWSKEIINNTPSSRSQELTQHLKELSDFCHSLPFNSDIISKPLSPNTTTGEIFTDLCWNEIGSIFASTSLSEIEPNSIRATSLLLKEICGESQSALYLCVRNFSQIKRKLEGPHDEYASKLCQNFPKGVREICLDGLTQKQEGEL